MGLDSFYHEQLRVFDARCVCACVCGGVGGGGGGGYPGLEASSRGRRPLLDRRLLLHHWYLISRLKT